MGEWHVAMWSHGVDTHHVAHTYAYLCKCGHVCVRMCAREYDLWVNHPFQDIT